MATPPYLVKGQGTAPAKKEEHIHRNLSGGGYDGLNQGGGDGTTIGQGSKAARVRHCQKGWKLDKRHDIKKLEREHNNDKYNMQYSLSNDHLHIIKP